MAVKVMHLPLNVTTFESSDKAIDKTYGELLCTVLRRDMDHIGRASHKTTYDGFCIEVVPQDDSDAVRSMVSACETRSGQVSTLLHLLRNVKF